MSALIEVAVDLPVLGTFTYRVPEALARAAVPGVRALVEFGNRAVAGVVLGEAAEDRGDAKLVQAVLDDAPLISTELIGLCRWISEYYRAPLGEALRLAMPPGTRISANLEVSITCAGRAAGALPRESREILAVLDAAGGSIERAELLRRSRARPGALAELGASGLLVVRAAVERARIRDRTERVVRLIREPSDEDEKTLRRAHARRAVLDALRAAGGEATAAALRVGHPRASTHLHRLSEDGLVAIEERVVRGVASAGDQLPAGAAHQLNDDQARALAAIEARAASGEFAAFLLHGITGSGKTEVYLQAIARTLERGRTAIVLVPEISLTPQLAARFRQRFGDKVAVLHSGLSSRDRYDEWHRLREGGARIALGARSAVFAPVRDLGMIVVDEEHDSSFKQDEGVRYNGRDLALVRAKRAGAVCVLGSATPSLESTHGTQVGRLELLQMPTRATRGSLPTVELIDLRRVQADKESMLTANLARAIEETLEAGDQTILFLNRRGWSTFVLCVACGDALRCPDCAVSLTFHRSHARMLCHYCGHQRALPRNCASCGAEASISRRGLGTEQIASAVAARFPGARVARLDRDVASGASIETELARVARREVDILVGTQMVTKGHDFPGVTLVGVLCADTGLSLPDFRASEKTFQLLTQVSGRAGRGDHPGRVIIQSYRTDHVAVAAAEGHDYDRFFAAESELRRELGYPPWGHLIAVRLDGRDPSAVSTQASALADGARRAARGHGQPIDILGPSEAPLARLKGRTRWHFWLRAPDRAPLWAALRGVEEMAARRVGGVRVTVDVDPVSAL